MRIPHLSLEYNEKKIIMSIICHPEGIYAGVGSDTPSNYKDPYRMTNAFERIVGIDSDK